MINQSVSQSINQSVNQSINQSINQSVSQCQLFVVTMQFFQLECTKFNFDCWGAYGAPPGPLAGGWGGG